MNLRASVNAESDRGKVALQLTYDCVRCVRGGAMWT
jgi:hypothetical protein